MTGVRKTIGWTVIAGGVAALILGALPAQAQGVVNLYSARHYNTDEKLYSDFTAKTGIKINRIDDDADKLIQRLKAEGANSPADLFITVDAGRIQRAAADGLLQPVKSAVLDKAVPEHLREPYGLWYGFSKRARVIVYSKARVKPADLSTYEALADPKWKGKIAIRSSTNVYNQSLTGSIYDAFVRLMRLL